MDTYPLEALTYASTATHLSTGDRIRRLLWVGLKSLDMETGKVSQVKDNVVRVQYVVPHNQHVYRRHTLLLAHTYCHIPLKQHATIDIPHISQSTFAGDIYHRKFKMEAYIGTVLTINDVVYGAVSFASRIPRYGGFSDDERLLVDSISRRIALALNLSGITG